MVYPYLCINGHDQEKFAVFRQRSDKDHKKRVCLVCERERTQRHRDKLKAEKESA